jgi:hypothetical protein
MLCMANHSQAAAGEAGGCPGGGQGPHAYIQLGAGALGDVHEPVCHNGGLLSGVVAAKVVAGDSGLVALVAPAWASRAHALGGCELQEPVVRHQHPTLYAGAQPILPAVLCSSLWSPPPPPPQKTPPQPLSAYIPRQPIAITSPLTPTPCIIESIHPGAQCTHRLSRRTCL